MKARHLETQNGKHLLVFYLIFPFSPHIETQSMINHNHNSYLLIVGHGSIVGGPSIITDIGGCLRTNSLCAIIAAWLNSSLFFTDIHIVKH